MSLLQTDVSNPLGAKVATESSGNASTVNQIDDTGGTIYQIEVSNLDGNAAVFLKLWQGTNSTPTVGSDAPDHVIRCLAASTVSISYSGGLVYGTAVRAAVVEAAGGTEGTTDPTATVKYSIRYTT